MFQLGIEERGDPRVQEQGELGLRSGREICDLEHEALVREEARGPWEPARQVPGALSRAGGLMSVQVSRLRHAWGLKGSCGPSEVRRLDSCWTGRSGGAWGAETEPREKGSPPR